GMPLRCLPSASRLAVLASVLVLHAAAVGAQAAGPTPTPTPGPNTNPAPAPQATPELHLDQKTLAAPPPRKRFFLASFEVGLLEFLPWAYNRYVADDAFAHISWHTVSENWHTGFVYDRDDFNTNQFAHPYHGSLYFDAARSNGYTYWESGLFTLAGAAIW